MLPTKHYGTIIGNARGYNVIDCASCEFAHLDPIPSKEALSLIYPQDYYETENPDWIDKTLSEKAYWLSVYRERYETFERFVVGRRLLDIGSFLGLFQEVGERRGWNTLGIEPSSIAVSHTQYSVLHGFFDDFNDSQIGLVDVVNLTLTLEHVNDPTTLLKRVKGLLRPSGLVCIEVPNDFNPLQTLVQERLGKDQYWIAPPHHINYFSFASLSRLVKRIGFSIVEQTTTFPMEWFALMGYDYIGNDTIGRICHRRRMALETNLGSELKQDLYRFLASKGYGREVVLYAQVHD